MRKSVILLCAIAMVMVVFGCGTSGGSVGSKEKTKLDIYMVSEKTDTHEDVYAIGFDSKAVKGVYSHTHDRYEKTRSTLMKMEFGTFLREGNTITFTPKDGKPYTGVLTEKGLEVEGRVYILKEEKEKK